MAKRSITLVFLLCISTLFGQNDSIPVPIDQESILHERSIDEDLSKKYTGEEFNYDVKTGESQNLLARFIKWLLEGIGNAVGIDISPETLLILEYLIYGLMGLLVIFILIRVFVNEKFNAIFTKKAKPLVDINLSEQHIESVDLDSLMDTALKNKDYRLAVRYQFLKILKLLSQKEIIEWHFEKTNSDYEKEIGEVKLQTEFRKASYLYEYIWYGEQYIDEMGYTKTASRFAMLNSLIR
ncbi:hypothetical protein [Flagellimonas pacifica]|uniref:DUF4129 domain-containing protein n=1 Tax=Flagellimonas pacifica TaxID=1247520 RepID=A0A285MQF5_9FLAO|nr:hypothetical protein [Allomuricauda parva]SNY99405.1 hypothetical protein SAMN06265377_1210 [Allomuricauda parva]